MINKNFLKRSVSVIVALLVLACNSGTETVERTESDTAPKVNTLPETSPPTTYQKA